MASVKNVNIVDWSVFVKRRKTVKTPGKRYRRQDEIGTPFCITIDFDSLEDGKATIRNRDTMEQERVELTNILKFMDDNI